MEASLNHKLASLSLISQCKLESVLTRCGDKKDLIIDHTLIKPLERICGVNWLRQNGVEKIYKMDPQLEVTSDTNRVYLIPACKQKYKCVLDQISSVLRLKPKLADESCFYIIVTPRIVCTFHSLLENRGLYGIVKLYQFSWEFISVDEQLLSLELPFMYKQLYVEQNHSLLTSISMNLWSLFQVIGQPNIIFSVGKLSSKVLDIMEIYKEVYNRDFLKKDVQDIGALVIIDRDQDYASSLLTPATYSGLLNELFTINCGNLELNVNETKLKKGKLNFCSKEEEKMQTKNPTMILDSSVDNLYGEIKYRHFSEVLGVLSSKAKLLKNEDVKALGLEEIKHFVANKLQHITTFKQNLVNHVLACETIIQEMSHRFESIKQAETDMMNNRNKKSNFTFVDENFGTDIHMYNSLRLMCLLSLTQGLSSDEYNLLINKYLLAFGHKHLPIFTNLINTGLLIQPNQRLTLSSLSNKNLLALGHKYLPSLSNLIKTPDKSEKSSSSYVFNGGYEPLISFICNAILTSDSLMEVLAKLFTLNDLRIGGKVTINKNEAIETLNEKLNNLKLTGELDFGSKDVKSVTKVIKTDQRINPVIPLKSKTILVYVIGGVNYAEIAACDVLQRETASKIYIASDSIRSGGDIMAAHF